MQELKVSESGWFVTLTYDTSTVPLTDNGFMTLRLSDVQKFMKRLRKARPAGAPVVKYYYVGEYGGRTQRPHYHLIIFNVHPDEVVKAWSYRKGSKRLAFGYCHFGQVSLASVGYTLKYMCKPPWAPKHQNDDRVKQFSAMSRGIGLSYLTEAMRVWHEADLTGRVYVPLADGKKAPLPRYYRNRIYTEADLEAIGAHFASLEANLAPKSPSMEWNKLQSDIASFKAMYARSMAGRNVV